MQAALRHRGWIVNHKKIKRLMREHALHPPRRRRFGPAVDGDRPVMALARLIVREGRRRRGGAEQQIVGLEPLFPADHELVATLVPPEPVPVQHAARTGDSIGAHLAPQDAEAA